MSYLKHTLNNYDKVSYKILNILIFTDLICLSLEVYIPNQKRVFNYTVLNRYALIFIYNYFKLCSIFINKSYHNLCAYLVLTL